MRSTIFSTAGLTMAGALVALLVACSGDDGAAGPAGPAGAAGAAGPAGPAGAAGPTGAAPPAADAGGATGAANAVYTLSNDTTENAIYAYDRAADGTLTPRGAFPTGGTGLGVPLADQGALAFDPAKNVFYAVNAGDSSISMLALRANGNLVPISKVGSGGVQPVSVTFAGDVVYVLNAGGDGQAANISGFHVGGGGLTAVASSTQLLSADSPGPAEIHFNGDGSLLVVTEKGTNKIDTFPVASGVAGTAKIQNAAGTTPYGFAFAGGTLVVSEAFGGTANAGATSSYTIAGDGTITAKSPSVTSQQSAPCWVAIAGTHAYVTNTASNSVTSYAVGTDGAITMVDASGVSAATGKTPTDVAVSSDSGFLYVLNAGDHSLSSYAIGGDGKLTKKPDFAGLPEHAVGLVAR